MADVSGRVLRLVEAGGDGVLRSPRAKRHLQGPRRGGTKKDLFPGFFLLDVEENIRPKLRVLQEHGFYDRENRDLLDLDSCGAHSPRV
jgi:hypothetical protein